MTLENAEAKDRPGRSFRNPGFTRDDRNPVVCVNWDDAGDFGSLALKEDKQDIGSSPRRSAST